MPKRNVDVAILTEGDGGEFEIIAGQRSAEMEETREEVDVTDMSSEGGYQEFDYGLGSWNISCDGVYVKDNASFDKLKQCMRSREFLTIRISEDGKGVEEGTAVVTSRSIEGAYDGESEYSCELIGTGQLKEVVEEEVGE